MLVSNAAVYLHVHNTFIILVLISTLCGFIYQFLTFFLNSLAVLPNWSNPYTSVSGGEGNNHCQLCETNRQMDHVDRKLKS